ncbi:hypothetical protein [Dongshaea marina]|uniref:hypothetical protein n=1 Tax=Dongshaea marina TaxID=2047966 RepID=UPI00131F0EA7|nr:hypothetical protein [Dongshaea marina]
MSESNWLIVAIKKQIYRACRAHKLSVPAEWQMSPQEVAVAETEWVIENAMAYARENAQHG